MMNNAQVQSFPQNKFFKHIPLPPFVEIARQRECVMIVGSLATTAAAATATVVLGILFGATAITIVVQQKDHDDEQ